MKHASDSVMAGGMEASEPQDEQAQTHLLTSVSQPPGRPFVFKPVHTCRDKRCSSSSSSMCMCMQSLCCPQSSSIKSRPFTTPSVNTHHTSGNSPLLFFMWSMPLLMPHVSHSHRQTSACGTNLTDTLFNEHDYTKTMYLNGTSCQSSPPWNCPVAHTTLKVALSGGAQPEPGTVHAQTQSLSDDSSTTGLGANLERHRSSALDQCHNHSDVALRTSVVTAPGQSWSLASKHCMQQQQQQQCL